MPAIVRKELADYFTSIRCLILFVLVFLAAAGGLYAAYQGIRGASGAFVFLKLFTSSGEVMPPLVTFLALFVPIIGIALGFDAVNSERTSGTLSRLLSQPVYRDSIINAKFLAGLFTLTIMVSTTVLIVAGYGLRMIGVPPNAEEIIRIFLYMVYTIVFGAFWMAVAILFSVLFRRIATSLLSSLAVWLFFSFFYGALIVQNVAKNAEMYLNLSRLSPNFLFSEAIGALLQPQSRGLGLLLSNEATVGYMIPNPLSLGQSLVIVWPQLTSLIALTIVCFAISYVLFMRQEIRST